MQIKSYEEALKYLDSFVKPVVFARITPEDARLKDPLDRMRMLLKLLGNPQDKFRSIQVSGTSGKGSTAYLISHTLTTAGYKTGFTMSPHLEKVNERIQINDQSVSDKEFTRLVDSMIRIIESMRKMQVGEPSYFEITMAMAFKYFAEQKVDIAVVEVGMEGKYDASNTLRPLVAVLTNIDLDHTELLGNTVEDIAKEAVEIIQTLPSKREQFAVTGVKQPSVIKIVEDKARKVGARLFRLKKDFGLTKFEVSLLGDYQKENASLAVKAILELDKFGFKVSEENIKKALKTAFFPGRFEVIPIALRSLRQFKNFSNASIPAARYSSPRDTSSSAGSSEKFSQAKAPRAIIFDGAHNPAKMRAFLTSLEKIFPKEKKIFVIAFKSDKDAERMLSGIVKVADKIIATRFNASMGYVTGGAMEPLNIKNQISKIKYDQKVMVEDDSRKAIEKALNISVSQYPNINSIIVVTGSLYLVGEIRNEIMQYIDN